MPGKGGAGSRAKTKQRRAAEKRSRKEMNQTCWAIGSSDNQKNKSTSTPGRSLLKHKHVTAFCGNPACFKCGASWMSYEDDCYKGNYMANSMLDRDPEVIHFRAFMKPKNQAAFQQFIDTHQDPNPSN